MEKLKLKNNMGICSINIDTDFIDHHMIQANGEYVKVYLLLLRYLSTPGESVSVTMIADTLDITEKDVSRALRYWNKAGLIEFETEACLTSDFKEPSSEPLVAPTPVAPQNNVQNITPYRTKAKKSELKEILFIAETYLGKTLSYAESKVIEFIAEDLALPKDLIDYLIDYCVENNHKDLNYIKKVALSWSEQGFTCVEDAKSSNTNYNANCYGVLKAFGINGRAPGQTELSYIKKWTNEMGFPLEIVLKACDKTILAIHQPSFDYADKILENWLLNDVKTLGDIEALDYNHKKATTLKPRVKNTKKTGFNNFDERSYDMDDLEKKLIQ
ncbi:MAG TPA: DnaD domain protein [Candidatus Dorea intestinavium]|nr:DnaD domain protein [Candidatus Dorea intestinavium]